MGHTYASNLVHCVFSTKERAALISEERQEQLWGYLFGVAKNEGLRLLAAGGTSNHVHLLLALPPTCTLSEAIKTLKGNSSRWMGTRFSWQEGYGGFSVSSSQLPVVKAYIQNQAKHHKKRSFEDEFLALLRRYEIDYDPRYVFG